jgi:predicted transcriptional regulator of viral defense system
MRILKSAQMSQSDHILDLARHRRVLRAADVREHGWSPQLLRSLYRTGKLQRVARDLYSLPDIAITAHRTLIEVRQRVPKAVLCLLSALQFHGLGTQMPQEVGVALPEATQPPGAGLSWRGCGRWPRNEATTTACCSTALRWSACCCGSVPHRMPTDS